MKNNRLPIHTDERSSAPLDFCNTCHGLFDGPDDDVWHQTLKNQRYLATIVDGQVVQECCEQCVQEIIDDYGAE